MPFVHHDPRALRLACRSGEFDRPTAGHVPGFAQANLVIVPQDVAADFLLFCQRNPQACPLLEVTPPGARTVRCADGADLATDAPGYRVYRHGDLAEERPDVASLWHDDLVSFLIGCSFSFEGALEAAGVPMRHVRQGRNVAMFRTSVACAPAGRFSGELVVSMRPVRRAHLDTVRAVCAAHPQAHGAPVHVGDARALGIADLQRPDYGDAVEILGDEVPVFWACGVTPQWVAQRSRLPLCITHAPGKMFVTDLRR